MTEAEPAFETLSGLETKTKENCPGIYISVSFAGLMNSDTKYISYFTVSGEDYSIFYFIYSITVQFFRRGR
jgi:hypothetical protein